MIKNRVAELRCQKGWSQKNLSDISGVSVRSIQRIESTGDLPNLYSALNICKALDKFLDEVWWFEADQDPA